MLRWNFKQKIILSLINDSNCNDFRLETDRFSTKIKSTNDRDQYEAVKGGQTRRVDEVEKAGGARAGEERDEESPVLAS